ncbi:hypothetical protein [Cardiobacterium hominis]|uniref:hypothetical protein n=1 Tax=Cardiobacterium hominis TaxID=2718 RepID=UPI0028E7D408|nr:hypothetical protein [Cardiobacterium hominis]
MNRTYYYRPDDRTDHPDINLLTPGMGVLTALCVCLIFASAHLPQLPNPFHILFGYTTLVALNLLWQGRCYFRPRPLPSPMFACDGDGLTVFDRDGARLGNWRWADIAELRATEPDPVAVIRGGADPDAVWLEIVLREAAPSGLGESDRLRRWLDAIEPQRGQIAIHVHLSEAVPSDHAPTTRLHLGADAADTLADALFDIDQYHQEAQLAPPHRPANPYRADAAAILIILAADVALSGFWHFSAAARLLIPFSLPLIAVFNLWAAVRLCQAGIAFTKTRRHAPPPARVIAQAPAIAAQPAPQPPPAPDSVRPRPAPRRKPRSITPPAVPRPAIAARAWYTEPRAIRRANIHNHVALAIALVLAARLVYGTPHPVWHAAGLLLALAYAAAITFTAFHQPGAPRLQLDANGIRSRRAFLPWDDYSYATINERPAAFTHQPRPDRLDIHGINRRLPISIAIATIGYRAAQDIIAACNHGKAQHRATVVPDDGDDFLEHAYRRILTRGDLTPAEQANLRDLVDALKGEPAAPPTGDDIAALRAEIQQQHPPAVAEALLRHTRHLDGKADNRRSYPLHIRPLAWALLIANDATALALAVLIALNPPATLAPPLLAWLAALTPANLIAWRAPWRWQAVAKTPEKEQTPSLAGRSPQRGRVGEGVAIVNIRPSAADIPPHQWYKHPRAIARGNWHTFAWLTTAALLAMLISRGVASGYPVALALLLPLAFIIRAAVQAARHAFSHHDAPLVRLDADGIHLSLQNCHQRTLARLPTRGASLHAGDANCHIAWDEIAYISALKANRYRAQQLLIEDQDGDNHGIYTAPLGDYDTVCTIAATARVCCDHDHWPMPGHDALPPPRLRPFARILLAANIALITIWLALNLLVQQGLMTLPFADPALPLLELPPFHLHAILPFGAYPHTNALILLTLTALNLAAWLAPWRWQAETP